MMVLTEGSNSPLPGKLPTFKKKQLANLTHKKHLWLYSYTYVRPETQSIQSRIETFGN